MTQMTQQGGASTGGSKAPNRLRQYFNSLVTDLIPLGPRRVSVDDKDSINRRPDRLSQQTSHGSPPVDHRKQHCPFPNSTGGSPVLTLHSLGKRNSEPAGVDKRSCKQRCSTHVATSARPTNNGFLRTQESCIPRAPGGAGKQDRGASTTVSFQAKSARQVFSKQIRDQNCDTKENNGAFSQVHVQPVKPPPTQLLRPAELQAAKPLYVQPARLHDGSTVPCSLGEGPRDRPSRTCADVSQQEQPSMTCVDNSSKEAAVNRADQSLDSKMTKVTPAKFNSSRSESIPHSPEEKMVMEPLDLELGLGLGFKHCKASSRSSSSSSSEDEPLLSLQEIMSSSTHNPSTPQNDAFSEPSTPVSKVPASTFRPGRSVNYKNTLEQMLKEKAHNQRLKEVEKKLLLYSKEDLLKLVEEDESEGCNEDGMLQEHREILQKFSVVSSAIPDVHPGEEVFILANFGCLFSQHTLELRKYAVTPQNLAQRTLLRASTEQLPLLISAGLLLKAYRSSPCPPVVSSWLFQMMSVHSDRKTSTQILQSMKDICLIAAEQIVVNQNRMFEVWTPSLQDVAFIFLNMGVPFVTLFPLESLQPPFTEGDLLQSAAMFSEARRSRQELKTAAFPQHNVENVIKYLELSTALASRAYSDQEILLLLTAICKVSLETQLQLMPMEDIRALLRHLVDNTRLWDQQLSRICLALADLAEDHHNLRHLTQLLPDNRRGKQLRKHVSLSIISKLLNDRCTYKPTSTDFQLADLHKYLPRMRPSALLRGLLAVKREAQEEDSAASQDQQAYYLCYSLLVLLNEASNFELFPTSQKKHLLMLCAALEKHIKCDIRESEKRLYRSKVKDLVARIYTRWQFLLQKSRPLQGQLYDYWQPPPEDAALAGQHNQPTEEGGPPEHDEAIGETSMDVAAS